MGRRAGVCESLITGSTPAKAKLSSRVVRVWHYTPRFNVSQTLNVAVSRCAVIPEWLCAMLGHEGPTPKSGGHKTSTSSEGSFCSNAVTSQKFIMVRSYRSSLTIFISVAEDQIVSPTKKQKQKKSITSTTTKIVGHPQPNKKMIIIFF